jgi:GNAT superfamily N-acetyltransferase
MMAEVAFVVQDEWQKRGLGSFLLAYLTQIARQRGVKVFAAKVLPGNRPMLAVFHNSGFPVKTEFDGEAYSLTVDLAG